MQSYLEIISQYLFLNRYNILRESERGRKKRELEGERERKNKI